MPGEIVPSTSSPSASTSASRGARLSPRADLNEALHVPLSTRSFAPQFASLYHFRLRKLKGAKRDAQGGLLRRARKRWGDGQLMQTGNAVRTGTGVGSKRSSTEDQGDEQAREQQDEDEGMEMEGVEEGTDCGSGGSKRPAKVEYAQRILDIEQGRLVAVCGIVYCSMRLKPDVLEDLTREVSWRRPGSIAERSYLSCRSTAARVLTSPPPMATTAILAAYTSAHHLR